MATLLPQRVPETLKDDGSKSVNLIKPLHEVLFDYLSLLGLATAVFGVYTISMNSISETLQCVPGDVLRYSDYRSVKDYVNGKCAGSQLVLRVTAYSYFLFLFWFFIGLLQLWYRIPKINGKIETFHKYVLRICNEPRLSCEQDQEKTMKNIDKNDKLFENFLVFIQLFADTVVYKIYLAKLVLQAILSTLVYWVIELVLFRSWIHNSNSSFSCSISCQSFDVVNCEFLLEPNARGISIVNFVLTSTFAVLNVFFLFKTFFRVNWFNSSDFPLHSDTMTSKRRYCFDSFAELSFLLMLLRQHNNIYSRVLNTMKVFIPHEVKQDVDQERKGEISAQTFRKMLNGVWSGEVRLLNYKESPHYFEDIGRKNFFKFHSGYFKDYHERNSDEPAVYKLLRTYGLEMEGEAEVLAVCIRKKPKSVIIEVPSLMRPVCESEELFAAAAQFNTLIVLAEMYTRQDFKRTTGIELQFVLPSEMAIYETSKTLLCPVVPPTGRARSQYKVLKITGAPSFKTHNQEQVISLETT